MTHQITVNLDEDDELLKFFPQADMTHPTIRTCNLCRSY